MPIYEYECRDCGHRFEKLQKISSNRVRTCPECKGKVDRLLSAPAIQFKGEGWYVTDYSDKGKKAKEAAKAEQGDSGKKSDGDKKGEDKKADAKKKESGSDKGGAKKESGSSSKKDS